VIVQANKTTNVSITLACAPIGDSGDLQVGASTFNCATVNYVSAMPSEVKVGHSVIVSASATGPDPTALTYAWSAPSGTFSAPSSPSSSFTCTAAGTVPVTLQLGDGTLPDGSACDPAHSTTTLQITCD
jgi:hypothetical protein